MAKSSRAACKKCKEKIEMGTPRLAYKTEADDHHGSEWGFFHPTCGVLAGKFWKNFKAVETVVGLEKMPPDACSAIKSALAGSGDGKSSTAGGTSGLKKRPAASEASEAQSKKAKVTDKAAAGPSTKVVEEMQKLSTDKLKALLKANDMNTTGNKTVLVARAADGKAFGALPRCPSCSGGRIRYEAGKYSCPGYMDDDTFVKCFFHADTIKRNKWVAVD